jgi:hypothetical protein
LLDELKEPRIAYRFRKNPVPVNATTIRCLICCDERTEENDWDAVQRSIRFELRRDFEAVRVWHYKIDKHEVGLETARRLQCTARNRSPCMRHILRLGRKLAAHCVRIA